MTWGRIRVRSASWSTVRPRRVRAPASSGPITGSAGGSNVSSSMTRWVSSLGLVECLGGELAPDLGLLLERGAGLVAYVGPCGRDRRGRARRLAGDHQGDQVDRGDPVRLGRCVVVLVRLPVHPSVEAGCDVGDPAGDRGPRVGEASDRLGLRLRLDPRTVSGTLSRRVSGVGACGVGVCGVGVSTAARPSARARRVSVRSAPAPTTRVDSPSGVTSGAPWSRRWARAMRRAGGSRSSSTLPTQVGRATSSPSRQPRRGRCSSTWRPAHGRPTHVRPSRSRTPSSSATSSGVRASTSAVSSTTPITPSTTARTQSTTPPPLTARVR